MRGACVIALCAAAVPSGAQTPPVFGARVETVYVDVFVTRDGVAVRGLEGADFELKDNGVVQRVELVTSDSLPLLAVLAFDASGSVAGSKLAALQAAGGAFLDSLKPADEAALIEFNEEVRWASEPTPAKDRVKASLQALRPHGGTAVLDGLFTAVTLPTSRARSLVVLFSDGEDNVSWLGEKQVKTAVERSNALVHVVGIVPPEPERAPLMRALPPWPKELPHNRALRQIAEATGGRFWRAESPERLRQTFAAIAQAMSYRYILRFEPAGSPKPGWHALDVKLRGKSGRIEARRGYWVAGR